VFKGFNYIKSSKGGTVGYSPGPVQVTIDDKQMDVIFSFWIDIDNLGRIRDPMIPFGGGQDQFNPSIIDGIYYYHHTYYSRDSYGWSIGVGQPKRGDFRNYDYLLKWFGW
jgi:hypothetical protein